MNKKILWILGGILILLTVIYISFYVFDFKKMISSTFSKIDTLLLGGTPEEVNRRVKNIKYTLDVTLPKIDKIVDKTDIIVDYIDEKKGQIVDGTESAYQAVKQVIPRVTQVLESINGFVDENKSKVTSIVDNIQFASQINRDMSPAVERIINNADQTLISFQDILPSIQKSANGVNELVPKVNTLLDENTTRVNDILTNVKEFTQLNNEIGRQLAPAVLKAADNINESIVSFQDIIPSIQRSANNVEQILPKIDKTLTEVNTFVDENKGVVSSILTENMPYIKSSLTGLNEAIPKLNSLLTDVEESKLKKWFFGGSKKEEFGYYTDDDERSYLNVVDMPSNVKANLFSVY